MNRREFIKSAIICSAVACVPTYQAKQATTELSVNYLDNIAELHGLSRKQASFRGVQFLGETDDELRKRCIDKIGHVNTQIIFAGYNR